MSTPSPNDTVITPGVGSIIDSGNNVYTITPQGTVDVNGNPLGYTANVIEGAYVNGSFWQENSSDLWWQYTGNPAAPWTGLGTSTSPLQTQPPSGGGTGGAINNNGTISLDSGTAEINATVLGIGSWDVYDSALTMDQTVGPFQSFFIGYGGVLIMNGDAPYFDGGITALLSNASIQITDLPAASYSYANNVISFFNSAGTDIGQYHLSNATYPAGSPFGVYAFGTGVVITGQNVGATPLPVHT